MTRDKFTGCFLALAYGDAICAPYEGGLLERLLWRVIGKTNAGELKFTDDTQMSLDIARSFLELGELNQDALAKQFANSYQWCRGYGPGAAKILKKIRNGIAWQVANTSVYKQGSFGNGAAMRAPILALCLNALDEKFRQSVIQSAEITHAHPLAIDGALLIACTTAFALSDLRNESICSQLLDVVQTNAFEAKIKQVMKAVYAGNQFSVKDVRTSFGNDITAEGSCVTAVYLALRFRNESFDEMIMFIKQLGGDTDTIAAMTGAIWGAFNGESLLLKSALPKLEAQQEIKIIATQLYQRYIAG